MDFNFSSLRRNVVITLFISLVSLIFLFALVSAINSSNSSLNSSSQTIAVNNSEILNQNNLKQDLTDNSYESIKTKLSLGYYSIVSLERQPIIFGKPVEWFLTVSDGLYTYLVEFQTSPIFLKEYDNKDNSTWNKTLVLYTNYSGVYKDVEVNVSLPSDNFVVVPALNYTYSDNVLSLLIPELNKSTKIVIVGSFSNESINLSQLNVSLNVSINESLFNEEEVNSLSNSVFATDKEQYFVNDTVNFVLLQNISGYSIYVDTPSGNTLYVENTSLKVSEPGDHLATLIFNGSYYSLRFKVVSRSRTSFENGFGVFNITSSSGVVENFFVDDDLNIFFRIGNLSLGQKVAVNILLPFQIPEGVYFYVWKDSGKGKIKVPFNLSDSRDRITLFLQDGVIDDDGLINGIIEDPLKLFIPNYNVNVSKINKNEAHIEISHRKVKLTSKGGDLKQTHVVDPLNLPSTPVSPDKFKYKLLKFRIENVSSGSSDIILNYESLPERFELWKFNPNTLEWYNFPYERINDTAIKITIFDGGFGDDDGIKNGIIEDDLGITYQWWNDSWPWRRAYNISNTAGDLTDFQVKLNFNSTNFNFSKTNSDGSDLRFTYYNASSDSETKLNYWIEYFNATQQQVIVWIKVPYLQNNTNTTIFVYYGNSQATSESNMSNVFIRVIDGLVLSWSLDEDQGSTAVDTSGNGYDGNIYGASWSSNCKFGSCLYFSGGTTDYIIRNPFNHPTDNVTVEFWMESSDTANSGTPYSYATTNSGNEFLIYDYNAFRVYRATTYRKTGIAANDGSWHHIAVSWTSNGGNLYMYEDGTQVYSNTLASGVSIPSGGSLVIGQEQDSVGDNFAPDQSFIGYLDEIRVYNRTLTLQELQDLYNYSGYTTPHAPGKVLVRKFVNPSSQSTQDIGEEYLGVLNITSDEPANNSDLIRNQQFVMNSTVVCERGECGDTNVYYQYYSSVTPTQSYSESSQSDFESYEQMDNLTIVNDTIILSQLNSNIPWWDYHWRYRIYINFSNPGSDLIDYPLKIILNSSNVGSNFNWSTDYNSLRFLKYDWNSKTYTKLNYWIEYFNASAQQAIVWVKVPQLDAGNNSIFVYYKNPNAVNESNVSNVFVRVIDGLVLSWSLDDGQGSTAADSSGNGYNGSIYGASWSSNCKFGSCLYFSGGTTDYIIKNPFNHPTDNITVEFWMNTSDTTNSGTPYSYATTNNGNEFLIFDYKAFSLYRATTYRRTGIAANDGSWHHIAVSWTSNGGNIYMYKDGVQAYSDALASGVSIPSGGSLVIGQEQDSVGDTFDPSQSFIGYMDEIRVYNRTLMSDEITDLYQNYGYTLDEFPGKVFVGKRANPEPVQLSSSSEEGYNQATNGVYVSSVFDAKTSQVDYINISWNATTNENTSIKVYTRTSTGQSAEWWDPDWLYRKEINVSNSGSSVNNYTLKLSINTTQLYNEGKLRSDCGDIRFAQKSTSWSELSYYIEECNVSGGNSTIWVNIPTLLSGTNTLYIYYGNPSAHTTSTLNALPHLEFGTVTLENSIDGGVVKTVNLNYTYTDPVVVAYVITRNDDNSVDVRVRNVQNSSFEIFMEQPDNGLHSSETIGWIAVEKGSFIDLNDLLRVESGKHRTDNVHREGNAFSGDTVSFSNAFGSAPVVLSTLNTYNNSAFMSAISYNPSTTGFYLQQEAGGSSSPAANETIGWIAFSQGSGTIDGISYSIAAIASDGDNDGVDDASPEVATYSFSGNPVIVVDGTTSNGADGYWARGAGTYTNTQADFYAEEDSVGNTERTHASEGFNWAAFYPEGSITLKSYIPSTPSVTFGNEGNYSSFSYNSSNLIWSPWYLETNGNEPSSPDNRFMQYKVEFNTTNENQTPSFNSIAIQYKTVSSGWRDMSLSDSFFRTENPYDCGTLNQSAKYCYPTRYVSPLTAGEFLLRSCVNSATYPEIEEKCTEPVNVSVWKKPELIDLTFSKDPIGKGDNLTISVRLISDDGVTPLSGYNLTFVDITGNGSSSYYIGYALTNTQGYATIVYTIPQDAYLGNHIINVSYSGDLSQYTLAASKTKTVLVSSTPKINSVNVTPSKVGFGYNVTIEANVTDERGLAEVYLNITNSSGSSSSYPMTHISGDIYRFVFTDTWHVDDYSFKVVANNTDGIVSVSDKNEFSVEVFANISVKTVLDNYKNRENVLLKNYTTSSWYYDSWDYRSPITIKSNTQQLSEYQVYLDRDLSLLYSNNKIKVDCSDLRFTFYNDSTQQETEIPYFIDYCNLSQSTNAKIWIKVPYISNTSNVTVYMYYGNPSATDASNISAVFSYTEPKLIGYVVSQNIVNNGLRVVSLEDGNNITVGSNSYLLDSLGTTTISSGLSIATPIKVTKLANFEGAGNNDDVIVPISWAGTEFIYGGMRDSNDEFCMLAPFGDASVTIYDGGVSEWSGTVTSAGMCVQNDITQGNAARIVSDKPILVFREGAGQSRDAWAFYPATTKDLYLPSVSTDAYVAAGILSSTVYYYTDSGSSGSSSVNADSDLELSSLTGTGNDGSGPAIKVYSTYPTGLVQQADSDGTESSVAVPLKEMSTVFGSGLDAEYIAIVTPFKNTQCSVYNSSGLVGSTTVSGSDITGVYKGCFNCNTDNVIYATGPWKLVCTNPVWTYYEEATDDETNMLGYKQMRQYIWPEPTVSVGQVENKPSKVFNFGPDFDAYLIMKVQYNNSGSWQDVETVIDDLSSQTLRTINTSGLDLASIWNNVSWDTANNNPGVYRVYAELVDKNGNVLQNYDGSYLSAYSLFNIVAPPLQVNISDIRVYDVTDSAEQNWKIYTNDLVGSGLNRTFNLYKDHVYRIEIDASNIGETVWNISTTNVSYFNFDPGWNVNTNYIWYSNGTLIDDRRQDTNFVGGSFDGNVSWNTSLSGIVNSGNSATFFVIVNLTSTTDKQVNFKIEHKDFLKQDFSSWHIIELDSQPPRLYNGIYNLTNDSIFRGDSIIAYARWDETIASANATYTTISSSTWATLVNSSPQNVYNWTNFTISSSSTWFLGEHYVKIIAQDESGNVNDTLPYLNLTVWGKAQVTSGSLNTSTINQGDSVRIACKVTDATDSDNGIDNYLVYFYNSTDLIGTNLTDSTGWAYYTYTDNSPGTETLKCNITENLTRYYKIDSSNYKIFTLTTRENIAPYYTTIDGPSLVHKGDSISLNVLWHDNYNLSNATLSVNESGSWSNYTTVSLQGPDAWANISYNVPTTISPGIIQWKQFAADVFNNVNNSMPAQNIEVWGWASITNENVDPASIQETNSTTMHCKVIDSNSSVGIQNYQVNFWMKQQSSSTYTFLGSNFTDSSGWANYTFVVNTAGTYDVKCNITDNASLKYNASQDDSGIVTLNVVIGNDVTPPKIVGNNYSINDTDLMRGDCVYISGLWDESINQSWVNYDEQIGTFVDYELVPPFTGNWTNATVCTNNSWEPGNHSIKLKAKDQNGNINDTLPYLNFVMWGRAKLDWISPTGDVDRGNITLICRVSDYDTLQGIENYKVTFYDGDLGYSIGYNYTNASGYAKLTYDFSNHDVGPDQLSCSIADDNDKFYKVTGSSVIYQTINLYGYLYPTIIAPAENSILHRGTTQSLNATVVDEFGKVPKDSQGNIATLNSVWYNSSQSQIATGETTTWDIPSDYELGPETLTFNVSATYYHPGSDNVNVEVYSYANVTWIRPAAGSYGDETLNLTCLVKDTQLKSALANYPVEFFDGSTSLGFVNTNSSGYAVKQISTSVLGDGTHNLKCVIYDNSSLYYNRTVPYEDGVTIIVDTTNPQIFFNPNSDLSGNYSKDWIFVNVTAIDDNIDTVLLYFNGTPETFANSQGGIYWVNKTSLQDGVYTLYAFVNDTSGNSNQTEVRTIKLDTTPPILTLISPQDKTYESNQVWINVSSNEDLNNCVFSLDSGSNTSMNKLNETDYYYLLTTSDGAHNVVVYCNDTVNNTASVSRNFTIDTVPPSVTLNYPVDYANLSTSLINFSCTASDSINLKNVSLYGNFSGSWQEVLVNTSPINNSQTIFQRTLSDGVYSWNCQACDDAQCSFAIANYTLVVDTTAPIVNIDIPQNRSYNVTTLSLNYTVSDSHLSECWYNAGSGNVSLPSCQNITLTGLTEGTHTITVYANDSSGNIGFDSVSYTIDLTTPQISIQSPQQDFEYQNSNSVDLNYTVSDDREISSCWYVLDNNPKVDLPGCINTTIVGLTNDNHTVTVYVNDTAGNVNFSSVNFSVNLTELVVTAVSPVNNSYYNTTWIWLNASTNKNALSCNFSLDDNANQSLNTADSKLWYYNYSGLTEGSHNVIYYCSDANNVTDSGYVYFNIDITTPSLTIESPLQNEIYNVSSVDLNYTVSDNSNLRCYYDLDNAGFVEITNCNNIALSGLSEGLHTVVVKAIDSAQNANISAVDFYVDTIAPNITLISPINTNYTVSSIWVNVSSNENLSSCLFDFDSQGIWNSLTKFNETYYYNLSTLADGKHNVSVRCNDTAGNFGTNFTEFTVDTTGPVFTFVAPTPKDNGAVDTLWVYINVTTNEPADVLTLTWVNSTATSYYTMNKVDATHFYYNVTNLIDGWYNYSVSGNDTLGNTASSSVRRVLVSTEAPIVDITSPQPITYNTSIIDLNVSSNKYIEKWWFDLNGVNYSFEPNTTITAKFGANTLTVFAMDSGGKVGNATVNFDTDLNTWADTFDGYTGISYAENLLANKTISEARIASCWPAVSTDYNNQTPDCWKYRKELNISSSSTLTDYQVRLSLNLSQEKSSGKVSDNCKDLRFTYLNSSSQEQTIAFWVEDCGSAFENSTIWIKVPEINSAGSIVYMYYGNPTAQPGDNASAVFEFFDDFDNVSSSVWGSNANNWYSTSGYAVPNATGSSSQITASYTYPNAYQTMIKLAADASGIAGYYRFGNGAGTKNLRLYFDPSNDRINLYNGGNNYYSLNVSQQTRFRIVSDFVNDNYELFVNDNQSSALTLNSASAGSTLNPTLYSYYVDSMYIDWIAVSKYSTSEPVLNSISSEERPLRNATVRSILLTRNSTTSWDTFDVNATLDGSSDIIFRILDSNKNSLCGDLSLASVINGYQLCANAKAEQSLYLEAKLIIDGSYNTPHLDAWSINLSNNLPDLTISNVGFSSENFVEGNNYTITVNVTNLENVDVSNVVVRLNVSFWNGTKTPESSQDSTAFSLNAGESKLISFNWTAEAGTHIFDIYVDPLNNIAESNESNNFVSVNKTTPAWAIYYGNFSYVYELKDEQDNNTLKNWTPTQPVGNLYFADTDSYFSILDLEPLNGTNDLAEADQALGLTGFNDSIERLFDKDNNGIPDHLGTFVIGGRQVTEVPYINSTNNSNFITALLWDKGDGGTEYNGSQDLVLFTVINANTQGKYGIYDYEARVPSQLASYKGSTNMITRVYEYD